MAHRHWALGLLAVAVAVSAPSAVQAGSAPAVAPPTVATYVLSPDPIGNVKTTPPSSAITVTVTAQTSTHAPVPGATIYLSFHRAATGGTAFVGATGLDVKPLPFKASRQGQVSIHYVAPTSYPNAGNDELVALNQSTVTGSTIVVKDDFNFSNIAAMVWQSKPIARTGSLLGNSTVSVVITAFDVNSALLPGVQVWIDFKPTTNGGSATVSGTPLTSIPRPFTTDVNGQVQVMYTTGATVPTTGSDVLVAHNASSAATLSSSDHYTYG